MRCHTQPPFNLIFSSRIPINCRLFSENKTEARLVLRLASRRLCRLIFIPERARSFTWFWVKKFRAKSNKSARKKELLRQR